MKRRALGYIALAGLLVIATPAIVRAAPQADADTDNIKVELAALNESLEELITLVRSHLESETANR